MTKARGVRYRTRPTAADRPPLRRLVAAAGVFGAEERKIALELLEERLRDGPRSGYSFVLAERADELIGYVAWGRVPLTRRSFDLYWIVVAPAAQGEGVGRALLTLVERAVAAHGGGNLYIETSARRVYERTRRFYRGAGYTQVARLRDFYARGDHKLVFCKVIRRRKWIPKLPPRRAPRVGSDPKEIL